MYFCLAKLITSHLDPKVVLVRGDAGVVRDVVLYRQHVRGVDVPADIKAQSPPALFAHIADHNFIMKCPLLVEGGLK